MAPADRDPQRIGTRIAGYRIDALLGAGGMGEVYRAHDGKLDRDVAIKLLPSAVVGDDDSLARFDREARLLASLNHPNIAAIYGIEEAPGGRALILELVEGETLAARLHRGPVPVREALDIAAQIASAIGAAHARGIIHRDLKPANVKIGPGGLVKVLDFGIAKSIPAADDLGAANAPTLTAGLTRDGSFLGTPSYASPEQVRGQVVDRCTDIWAFACVLFEMLTGQRAFVGDTAADTVAAVLEREPDWTRLPSTTPESIQRLLQRCFERNPSQRQRDIGDVRLELTHTAEQLSRTAVVSAPAAGRSRRLWTAAALLVAAGVGIGAYAALRDRGATPTAPIESPLQLTDFTDSAVMPSLSHDGRMLTFIRSVDFGRTAPDQGQIYVKRLPDGEPVQLTRGQGGGYPTFSPDDTQIIFTMVMPGLKWDSWRVPVLGGSPQSFLPNASGLVWLDSQRMVYSSIKSGLHMGIVASAPDGPASDVYFPASEGGMAHRTAPSPDAESLLVVEMDRGTWQPCRLMPSDGSSPGRAVGPLGGQCTSAAWSPDGRWMYFSSTAGGSFHIWRQRFPDGAPEQITFGPTEQEGTAPTPDGKYLITSMGLQRASIALHDASGTRQLTEEGYAMRPIMSVSGNQVFYLLRTERSRGQAAGELWKLDLETGNRQRLFPGIVMTYYSLSPDDGKVVFTSSGRQGGDGIWIAELDGRSAARQLTRTAEPRAFFGAPGEIVYLTADGFLHRMRDDGSGSERVSLDRFVYLMSVSPDGRWASVIRPQQGEGGGTSAAFVSLYSEKPLTVCNPKCGLGPAAVRQREPYTWSRDGTRLFVNVAFYNGPPRTVVLPYRAAVPLEKLWPKGLQSAKDVEANPGALIIDDGGALPGAKSTEYLKWTPSFQSNLYRVRLPN